MKGRTAFAGAFALILLAVVLFLTPRAEIPAERLVAKNMIYCSGAIKIEIEELLLSGELPNAQVENHCPAQLAVLSVEESGEFSLSNQQFGIVIRFLPQAKDKAGFDWHCQGTPERFVPKYCH